MSSVIKQISHKKKQNV